MSDSTNESLKRGRPNKLSGIICIHDSDSDQCCSDPKHRKLSDTAATESYATPETETSDRDCIPSSSPYQIPSQTNEWTVETLQHLEVRVERRKEYTPMQLVKQAFKTRIQEAETIGLKDLLKNFTKNLKVQKILIHFDMVDVALVDSELAYSLLFEKKHNKWHKNLDAWKIQPETGNKVEDWLYRRFDSYGENFARQLIQISLKKQNESLGESVYEGLFQQFAGMFGLESYSHSSLSKSTIKIKGTTVSSIPDIIFPHLSTSGNDNIQLMAISQVKSCFKCHENLQGPQTRSQKESGEKKKDEKSMVINHLDECLLGQIGGDFLIHFPFSQNDYGLLGLIVEKTHVTFAHFQCNETEFDEVVTDGNFVGSHPIIKFSKPFNYSRKTERQELIEPLLTLGIIQNMPFIM